MPQAIYIDYDVLAGFPPALNWSGIGDILCFHTGVLNWRHPRAPRLCSISAGHRVRCHTWRAAYLRWPRFVVKTRAFGRSKRVSVGPHGDLSFYKAREIAAEIVVRIKKGQPPFETEPEPDPTVANLAERYMRQYFELHCKPATVSHYRGMLRKHIVPALGELLVKNVTRSDILAFHTGLYRTPSVANRAIEILSKMFNLAELWGWRSSTGNPCKGAPRYMVEQHRERFLTREEIARLGAALAAAPSERLACAHAAAAIYLLLMTGCRRNEILGLRWDDLNFESGEMRLRDSKTDPRMVPMPSPAAEVFKSLSRTPNNPWVFPARKWRARLVNINDSWDRTRKRVGLDGVRLIDLRHTYASRALDWDPLPPEVLRRAVREMLVLSRLEERRLRGAGAGEIWEDACGAVDEWIEREGMLEGLTDPGAANRWKAVGPAGEGEP